MPVSSVVIAKLNNLSAHVRRTHTSTHTPTQTYTKRTLSNFISQFAEFPPQLLELNKGPFLIFAQVSMTGRFYKSVFPSKKTKMTSSRHLGTRCVIKSSIKLVLLVIEKYEKLFFSEP